MSTPRTIAIVGAGFSGTTLATHLLRLEHAGPLRIVLIERSPVAGGIAYARRRYPYLLNVPAGRMSANPLDPGEFLAFARRRHPHVTADDFLPRELFGEYLQSALASAAATSGPEVELQRLRGTVIALERVPRDDLTQVHLADGGRLSADTVVLALGNPPAAPLPGCEAVRGSARYLEDPWLAPAAVRKGETVLVVGTGLTMADTVLAGMQAVGGAAVFHAISRHGLVPARQTTFRPADGGDGAALVDAARVSLLRLFRAFRALAVQVERSTGDWRGAIALLRDLTPRLWRNLAPSERRRFLRHLRCYWDVHRHRLPESTWTALQDLRRDGKLQVYAGRIVGMDLAGHKLAVTWRRRGAHESTRLQVDRVINCTGPDYDVNHSRERLLRSLLAQGIAVRDPLGLGLATTELGALVDAGGRAARSLYCLGPMLRPAHWETTAVAELSVHAARLALHLSLSAGRGVARPLRGPVEAAAGLSGGRTVYPVDRPNPLN